MLKLCQRIYNLLDDLKERSDREEPSCWWPTTGIARLCTPIFMI